MKNDCQQNVHAKRAEGINELSVLLTRQSSDLTFLLDKFKNTKRSFSSGLPI